MAVILGSTRLLASGRLRGLRVGVVANPASVDHDFVHVVDRVRQAEGVTLGAIFGPQHGFRSDLQDNMIESPHALDDIRRVPVYSLYSETREPTVEMLADLDVLVVDLQDIGARIYTFVYTMANCLIAGRKHGVPVVVCDRPNPIGGVAVEGETLGARLRVVRRPIRDAHAARHDDGRAGDAVQRPLRHRGVTRGRHDGRLAPGEYGDDAGAPWVMPSPNMPALETAVVYPGAVLLEGTLASEGRGTTRPFEIVGAPWVHAEAFADRLNAHGLPGAIFRPVVFEPTFQKHQGTTCGGCQVHVTDRRAFAPVVTGVALIEELRRANPTAFAWRPPPYEYEHRLMPIDILAGSSVLRTRIDAGASAEQIAHGWQSDEEAFRRMRTPYLLYE